MNSLFERNNFFGCIWFQQIVHSASKINHDKKDTIRGEARALLERDVC